MKKLVIDTSQLPTGMQDYVAEDRRTYLVWAARALLWQTKLMMQALAQISPEKKIRTRIYAIIAQIEMTDQDVEKVLLEE